MGGLALTAAPLRQPLAPAAVPDRAPTSASPLAWRPAAGLLAGLPSQAMEILWWLAPATVATVTAMCWVSWHEHRAGREQDRAEVAARMGEALRRDHPGIRRSAPARPGERSSGVAVRRAGTGSSTRVR